jgi:hypothetical protein
VNCKQCSSPFLLREAYMIDHETEHLLSMTQAAKLLPGRPNVATLWRWRTSGCRGQRLESLLFGGRRYTSREAIRRFLAAINGEPVKSETPKQRERAYDRAVRRAEEMGV